MSRFEAQVRSWGESQSGGVMRVGGLTRRRLAALAGLTAVSAGVGGTIGTPVRAAAQANGVVLEDGPVYDAYVPVALKEGQFSQYTCEFDAAWAICKTFGLDVTLEEQVAIIGVDPRI
ncbi:MAG: hypothetical protein ACRDJC_26055, partial [Thermomicrobiales bacterium]